MRTLILLTLAGGLGALARYGLSLGVGALVPTAFPLGIFVVNILGCGLFGVVWELAATHMLIADATRQILLVGFMGSFTTFSTLIFDCDAMLRQGQWWWLALNLAGQVVLGVAALRLGMWIARG